MYDGVVRPFGGAAYDQKMYKNLISLSLLDFFNYGVIKVTQADMVLMKRNLHNGLYHQKGEVSKEWE